MCVAVGSGCKTPASNPPTAAKNQEPAGRYFASIAAGDFEGVRTELERVPELLHVHDDRGRSGFTVALMAGQAEIADQLRNRGYPPDLAECAWVGDWQRFEILAEGHSEMVNESHPLGGTAMYAAARGGVGSSIWRVYAQCGQPNPAREPGSFSTLRAALELDDLATAEMTAATLLSNGANPNSREPDGLTPLHVAAHRGSHELVEILLRKGASPDVRAHTGETPLELAKMAGHRAVVRMLTQRNVPRDHVTYRRAFTADGQAYRPPSLADLSLVSQRSFVGLGHFKFDELRARLAKEPRLVHASATTTELAIEAAGHTGQVAITRYLLEHGAPLTLPSAVLLGDLKLVTKLLDAHPDRIHERGPHDFGLLWYPVLGGGMIEMAELLLARGAQVEQQHFLGTTALHFAARGGQLDMVACLLHHGAQPDRLGRKFGAKGQTPIQEAQARGHTQVVRLLREHGGTVG